MTLLITLLILWIVSAPLSYIIMRKSHLGGSTKWTRMDRLFSLSMSVLYGPVMLVVIGIIALLVKLNASDWANQEVRW